MPTSARIVGHQTLNRIGVEVSYSGLNVPEALLSELALAGWRVPPTPPRPASAIDWSTPDAAAGTPYSIRDWWIDGLVLGAPAGSGVGGRWTDEERSGMLAATRRVLHRHGVRVDELDLEPDEVVPDRARVPEAVPPVADDPAASVEVFAALAPDRAQVFNGLIESLGSTARSHPAVVASTIGVGARAGSPARPHVSWIEAVLTPDDLAGPTGSTLLSSPLFRHALWVRHPVSGETPTPRVEGDVLALLAVVPADAYEPVNAAVGALCGVRLDASALQANGKTADVLVEASIDRLLFDAVCAEIVRISEDAVCRGTGG